MVKHLDIRVRKLWLLLGWKTQEKGGQRQGQTPRAVASWWLGCSESRENWDAFPTPFFSCPLSPAGAAGLDRKPVGGAPG